MVSHNTEVYLVKRIATGNIHAMEVIHTTLIIYAALCLGFTVILTGAQNIEIASYNNQFNRGDDVTLLCYFPVHINFSNCQWYFTQNGGEEMSLTNGTRYTWSCSQISANLFWVHIKISFKNVTFDDSGIYTCEAMTVSGADRKDMSLTVLAKPKITVHKTNYTAVSGTNVTLECIVNANGEIITSIEWMYKVNQQWIQAGISEKYFWTIQMPSLVISNVQRWDSGFYRCLASTRVGTAEGPAILLNIQNLPLFNPPNEDLTGSPLEKYVVPGVSVFVSVALIALIVVVILIRRKRHQGHTDKPNLEIRSTNEQKHPSLSEKIRSENNHSKFYVHLSGDMTYAQVIRKSSEIIDGNKSIRDTNIPQSDAHIDGNKSILDADASQVYMNINNAYAAVQQRSSTSNPNCYINDEAESENTHMNKTEELNYVELEFSSNAKDENSSHDIRGVPSDTTYTEVVVFSR